MASLYYKLIAATLPEATVAQCGEVEDIMRHDIFHSTLDWQTMEQLQDAARTAWHMMTITKPPTTAAKARRKKPPGFTERKPCTDPGMEQYTIPSMQDILRDFRKQTRLGGDPEFYAIQTVARWITCGHDLSILPLMLSGLTPEIVAKGKANAAERLTQ